MALTSWYGAPFLMYNYALLLDFNYALLLDFNYALLLDFSQCPYIQVTQGVLGFQNIYIDAVHLG